LDLNAVINIHKNGQEEQADKVDQPWPNRIEERFELFALGPFAVPLASELVLLDILL
jgi:hypothetical protein